jgi:surface antigen
MEDGMKIAKFAVVAAVALALAACSNTTGMGTKEGVGTVIGAAGGAWAGSSIGKGTGRIVATAAGTLLGGLIGNQIGRSLDRVDQMHVEQTAQQALERYPDGQSASWQNPNTGHSGYTVPTATYQTPQGQYCREYQTAVVVDGQTQSAHGTACRQPDGSWQLAS